MKEVDPNDPTVNTFVNIVVWYRNPYGSRLTFWRDVHSPITTIKESHLRKGAMRDDTRVFVLTDQEVIDMILPRII